MQFKARPQALKVALIYVIAAGGWILFSDKLVQWLVSDPETRIQLSILKGWGFVLVTGGLLFVSVQRLLRHWERAAEQHRQSERFLQSTLDALSSHIAILDEHGTIIKVNAAWNHFARENGLNGSHDLGGNYLRVCDAATGDSSAGAAAVAAGIRKVMAGQSDLFKLEYPCHSPQTQRWFVARVTRFVGAEPVRVVVAHENITARKRAEAAVRESEEEYRGLFEGSRDAIMTLDPATGRFTSGNPASLEMFTAKNEAEFMARSPMDLSPEQQPDGSVSAQAARAMMEIAQREGSHFFEWTHRRLNGEEFSADVRLTRMELRGKPVVMAVVRDITERKLVERKLRENEEHFINLFEKAPLGYQSLDADGCFIEVNQTWLTTLGYAREEVIGQWFGDFLAPEFTEAFRQRFPIFKAAGTIHSEFEMRHKSGARRFISFEGRIAHRPDGTFQHTRCILQDITERKQTETYAAISREVLELLNEPGILQATLQRIVAALKKRTGFQVVGIRLQAGEDFPYFVQEGFSEEFLRLENRLVQKKAGGGVCRDHDGQACLECTCGLVLSGKTGPANALFTAGGSFWTNNSPALLDIPPAEDPRLHPRNRCIHEGYASVMLVPIRNHDQILGLIQCNDRRPGCFTLNLVELMEGIAAQIGMGVRRKQLEMELVKKQSLLAESGEMSRMGTWELEISTQNLFWTQTVYHLHELDHTGPVTVKQALDFYTPESRPAIAAALERAIDSAEPYDLELEIITAKGRRRHIHTIGHADLASDRVFGFIQDITPIKQAEAELRETKGLLQAALDNSTAGIAIADAPSGILRYVNDAGLLIRGGDRQAIVDGVGINEYVASWHLLDLDGRLLETDEVPLVRAIRYGETCNREFIIRTDNNDDRVVMAKAAPILNDVGKIVAGMVVFMDITERKQTEARVQLHLTALSAAANSIIITDRQGKIEWVNPSFTQLTGYSSDEVLGHNPRLWKSDQHPRTFYATLWATIATGNVWQGEMINRRKDGRIYTEDATITPVRGADGQIAHFVAVKQDVTERRQLENQLRQAQKLEAVGTLAGGIAHDFNNILGAIISFTELTKMDLPADGDLQANLNEVLKASQRATALVRQILTFSRQQPKLERRSLQLAPVIKEALKLLRATLPSTIAIEQAIAADLPDVLADPTQMHQVMMNLCTNAAHAMRGQQGRLRVELALRPLDSARPPSPPALAAGDYVRLVISDTGQGMDAAVLERIFEPFFTTKGPGEGTGLGLSVVHGIVKDHEGVLAVASEPGRGTTFTIDLPAQSVSESQETEIGGNLPPGQGERILFVDDEPMLGGAARRMIQLLGYQPTVFSRPQAAWDEISGHPADYDLLITDLTMPGMTGLELAEKVLKLRPELPVILMTGDSGSLTEAQVQALGMTQLLHKPLNHQMLAQAIHQALPKRLNQRISTD